MSELKEVVYDTKTTTVLVVTGELRDVAVRVENYMREFSPTLYDTHVVGRYEKRDGRVEWIVSRRKVQTVSELREEAKSDALTVAFGVFTVAFFSVVYGMVFVGFFE